MGNRNMTQFLVDSHVNHELSPECIELLENITEDELILVGRCDLSEKSFKFMGVKIFPGDAPTQVLQIQNDKQTGILLLQVRDLAYIRLILKIVSCVIVEKGGKEISDIFRDMPKDLLEGKTIFTEDPSLEDLCKQKGISVHPTFQKGLIQPTKLEVKSQQLVSFLRNKLSPEQSATAERKKDELIKVKRQQLVSFLLNRDLVKGKKGDVLLDLGGIYNDVAENIIVKIRQDDHKLNLSQKSFNQYLDVKFTEREIRILDEKLELYTDQIDEKCKIQIAEPAFLTEEQKNDFKSAMATFYDTGDESKLVELFKIYDRDGNGSIEKEELKTVISEISGDHVSDEEVNEMFVEADSNKDGKIQLDEFITLMKMKKCQKQYDSKTPPLISVGFGPEEFFTEANSGDVDQVNKPTFVKKSMKRCEKQSDKKNPPLISVGFGPEEFFTEANLGDFDQVNKPIFVKKSMKTSTRTLSEVLKNLISCIQDLYPAKNSDYPQHWDCTSKRHNGEQIRHISYRWILQAIIQKLHPAEQVSEDWFYQEVARKLSKICQRAIDIPTNSVDKELDNLNVKTNTYILQTEDDEFQTEDDEFQTDDEIRDLKISEEEMIQNQTWDKAILLLEKIVLRSIPWSEYTTILLSKHYNLITNKGKNNPTAAVDIRNKLKIEEIAMKCIKVYKQHVNDDILTANQFSEIIALGGIKHRLSNRNDSENSYGKFSMRENRIQIKDNSTNKTIFQHLLEQLLNHIKKSTLFEAEKIQGLAVLIGQIDDDLGPNKEESTFQNQELGSNDDLPKCLDAVKSQFDRILFTSENKNAHICMDTINLLITIMRLKKVKGYTDSARKELLVTLRKAIPNFTKKAFNFICRSVDPTLQYKAEYAEKSLYKIEKEDTARTNGENLIVGAGPAIVSLLKGSFKYDTDSILSNVIDLGTAWYEYYEETCDFDWIDQVKKMKSLANSNFKQFEHSYFDEEGHFNQEKKIQVLNFTAQELNQISCNRNRPYKERRRSIELLEKIYGHTRVYQKDTRFYIVQSLSALSLKPNEYTDTYDVSLQEVAKGVLKKLKKEPVTVSAEFQFTDTDQATGNSLLNFALEKQLPLDHALAQLQKRCYIHHEKNILPLNLIQIYGSNPNDEEEFEPVNLQEAALQDFMKKSIPVWLILGDIGAGKSILLRQIEKLIWDAYCQGESLYVPIYINLAEIKDHRNWVQQMMLNMNYSKHIVEIMQKMRKYYNYLFLIDGYDEMKSPKNLYTLNKMKKFGKNTKMIIASRHHYLMSYDNYEKLFKLNPSSILLVHHILDVTREQLTSYLYNEAKKNKENYLNPNTQIDKKQLEQLQDWTSPQQYLDQINRIVGLSDLMKTPYMIEIIVDILPYRKLDLKLTRASIFKLFTKSLFNREKSRIMENESEIVPDLEKSFYNYSKDLAIRMWLLDKVVVDWESRNYIVDEEEIIQLLEKGQKKQNADFKQFDKFFANDNKTTLARKGAQIEIRDTIVRFSHQYIMEYYAARFLYDALKKYKEPENSCMRLLGLKLLKNSQSIDQESDVLNFLAEMIEDNDATQKLHKPGIFPNQSGVNIIEYLKDFINEKSAEIKNREYSTQLKNVILISSYFPQVFEDFEPEQFEHILKSDGIDRNTHGELSKIATEKLYKMKIENPDPWIESLYDKYANMRLIFELGGTFSGERSISDTGLYIALNVNIKISNVVNLLGNLLGKLSNGQGSYEGSMKDKKFHGKGTRTYHDHSFGYYKYEGGWNMGKYHQRGRITYTNGVVFEGQFREGKKHGFGKFQFRELQNEGKWPDVKYYKGEWENNKLLYGYLYFNCPRLGFAQHENNVEDYVQETQDTSSSFETEQNLRFFRVKGKIRVFRGFSPDIQDIFDLYNRGNAEQLQLIVPVLYDKWEIQLQILRWVDEQETVSGSKIWDEIAIKGIPKNSFGHEKWMQMSRYPWKTDIPQGLGEILIKTCPINNKKRIYQTHWLFYMPGDQEIPNWKEYITQSFKSIELDGYVSRDIEILKPHDVGHWVLIYRQPIFMDKTEFLEDQKFENLKNLYKLASTSECLVAFYANQKEPGRIRSQICGLTVDDSEDEKFTSFQLIEGKKLELRSVSKDLHSIKGDQIGLWIHRKI